MYYTYIFVCILYEKYALKHNEYTNIPKALIHAVAIKFRLHYGFNCGQVRHLCETHGIVYQPSSGHCRSYLFPWLT